MWRLLVFVPKALHALWSGSATGRHAFSLEDDYLDGSRSSGALSELAEQAQRFIEGARKTA